MPDPVDLYGNEYRNVEADIHRQVREETYGEDLGQTSWITAQECDELGRWLRLTPGKRLLEVGCGSGGVSVRFASGWSVDVTGIDLHDAAVAASRGRAERAGLERQCRFQVADASAPLPFPDGSFDAIFCNDAINHFRDREWVLGEWYRLLRPSSLLLYTDPIVVTGPLTNEEIAVRSSIGFFVFMPAGQNEDLLEGAGFRVLRRVDFTESVSATARRWRKARARHAGALRTVEGEAEFEKVQEFLAVVHRLAEERRLCRFAYLAERID